LTPKNLYNSQKLLIGFCVSLLLLGIGIITSIFLLPVNRNTKNTPFYLSTKIPVSQVGDSLALNHLIPFPTTFNTLVFLSGKGQDSIGPGYFNIQPNYSYWNLFRKIAGNHQDPIQLIFKKVHTVEEIFSFLDKQLYRDSSNWANYFYSNGLQQLQLDSSQLIGIFIPQTYSVYWSITPPQLLQKINAFNIKFWTPAKIEKLKALGLTPQQFITLVSIVGEESQVPAEWPIIMRVYLNRLRLGMPLQADPTVKYAVKNFALQRILKIHLSVESPFNTYKNKGLPPGPICNPDQKLLSACLTPANHNYLYFCAKEDFSGQHRFAESYQEHLLNARKYQAALTEAHIN
jgi:UPF0755 protein